uniref:Large ribosomal subunit protein uL18m n=1 Tax=Lygus hesperus TaxID=30085 RepID=A0A0A9X8W3_LYGHE
MSHFLPSRSVPLLAARRSKPAAEYVLNRNPRNLEKLCIAYRPSGWWLETPGRNYWHKLFIEKNSRNVSAYIQHYTGAVPLTASTREWAIKKHLFSSIDRSAYVNLGRILAHRCLQSGITEMICDHQPPKEEPKTNVEAFLVEMLNGGVSLEEPERYVNPKPSDVFRPEKPWTIHL